MPDLRRKRWLLTIKLDEAYSLIAFRTVLFAVQVLARAYVPVIPFYVHQ